MSGHEKATAAIGEVRTRRTGLQPAVSTNELRLTIASLSERQDAKLLGDEFCTLHLRRSSQMVRNINLAVEILALKAGQTEGMFGPNETVLINDI